MRIPPNILFGNKINTFGTNRLSRLAQLGHKFALPSAPRFYTQHFSRHHLSSKSNGCEIASDLEPENNKSHAPKESKDNNDKARSSGLETYWTEAREEYESLGRARSKIVRYISALLTIFVSALAFAYTYRRQSRSFEIYEEKFTANVTQTGKPDIGGSWTLTDHNNKSISSESLQGNWIIYYFGFVNCPDICPEEMEKIAALVRRTSNITLKLNSKFISYLFQQT
ncbi:MAG: Cu-binding protein [Marteilia pararefringens]